MTQMFLDKIVAAKRDEVARLKRERPLEELKRSLGTIPSPRDFSGAISGGDCAIIAEVKKRSPSKGVLREDFDPVLIARIYEENGAAAVSVLTDRNFFGGDPEYILRVKSNVDLPVLRKDFVVDPYQIYETRALGGDALLLIAAILGEEELMDYTLLAESLGLSALCEVHTAGELSKAVASGARIIGINNRDLSTFSTDLKTSARLARQVPKDRIIVSESGIRTRQDIDALMKAGVHVFLVGESLITSRDIGGKLRELMGRT